MSAGSAEVASRQAITTLASVRMRVAAGAGLGSLRGVDPRTRRVLDMANRLGAPLVPVVDAAMQSAEQRREIDAALTAAVAPARTIAVSLTLLPVVAVPALARLIGLDLVGFYTRGFGVVVAAVVLGLWTTGVAITLRLVRNAGRLRPATATRRVIVALLLGWLVVGPIGGVGLAVLAWISHRPAPPPPHPDLADLCDLMAAAVHAGMPAAAALRDVAPTAGGLVADARRLALLVELGSNDLVADAPSVLRPIACVIADARDSGGPLAPALRSLSWQTRADSGAATRAQAERLPAQLTFPTVLCLLPTTI